jgi:toxin ParE1/3/4
MVEIIWTNNAIADLKNIKNYIGRDNNIYARKIIGDIIENVDNLILFPELGRVVPEILNENVREIIFGNYRIVYLIKNQLQIDILTIHHSSKEFKINKLL